MTDLIVSVRTSHYRQKCVLECHVPRLRSHTKGKKFVPLGMVLRMRSQLISARAVSPREISFLALVIPL